MKDKWYIEGIGKGIFFPKNAQHIKIKCYLKNIYIYYIYKEYNSSVPDGVYVVLLVHLIRLNIFKEAFYTPASPLETVALS